MVFESLLVEVLNKFLGPYVKNLDPSQLKVGIWGGALTLECFRAQWLSDTHAMSFPFLGDVLLTELELKENALVGVFALNL